jgi:ADP-ribose pyrophosphatase YjhB (NUDIX family)
MAEKRYTARALMTARDSNGVLHLVTIRDADKNSRAGGTYDALPGGGNHEDEFPHNTVSREVREETGVTDEHALNQPRELGVVHLRQQGRPPHDVYYFEIRYPIEHLEAVLRAVAEGRAEKKEKNITAQLIRAPLDPRDFLGSQYAQIREVAPPLHRELFL